MPLKEMPRPNIGRVELTVRRSKKIINPFKEFKGFELL